MPRWVYEETLFWKQRLTRAHYDKLTSQEVWGNFFFSFQGLVSHKLCYRNFLSAFVMVLFDTIIISLTSVHRLDSKLLPFCPYSCSPHALHPINSHTKAMSNSLSLRPSNSFPSFPSLFGSIGSFSKPRRRRRRDCHQTKSLMSRTMILESWYISLVHFFAVLCKSTS